MTKKKTAKRRVRKAEDGAKLAADVLDAEASFEAEAPAPDAPNAWPHAEASFEAEQRHAEIVRMLKALSLHAQERHAQLLRQLGGAAPQRAFVFELGELWSLAPDARAELSTRGVDWRAFASRAGSGEQLPPYRVVNFAAFPSELLLVDSLSIDGDEQILAGGVPAHMLGSMLSADTRLVVGPHDVLSVGLRNMHPEATRVRVSLAVTPLSDAERAQHYMAKYEAATEAREQAQQAQEQLR